MQLTSKSPKPAPTAFPSKTYRTAKAAKWLPDEDLNLDKLNQNQLCYHYTIGQAKRE
jgi:hypothetical protein